MHNNKRIELFWSNFLEETNRNRSLKYFDCFHFENSKELANKLLALVLSGVKKATSSSLYFYERQSLPVPKIGDFNIITDWNGIPHCVTETTNVTILPFKEITFDICKREGEDDNLKSWQSGHINFFTEDGNAAGYQFSWNMPVVFEDFEVIFKA